MCDDWPLVTYDPETGFYRTEVDPGERRPFLALEALLGAVEDRESVSLPELYDVIDSEALNDLVIWTYYGARAESLELEYATDRLTLVVACSGREATFRLRLRAPERAAEK